MRLFKQSFPYVFLAVVLIAPSLIANFTGFQSRGAASLISSVLAALAVFLIPVVLFYRNLKVYLYLLTPLVVLTPVFLFANYYFGVPPGFELIAFTLQTNIREAREAVGPFLAYFIPFELVFAGSYLFVVRNMVLESIRMEAGACVSAAGMLLLAVLTWHGNELYDKSLAQINRYDLIRKYDYPFSLLSGAMEARHFLKKNNLDEARHFSFNAVKNDSLDARQVYVLIIGESSRYDRWQINGYNRDTSPRLSALNGLLTFKDVVAGAHYTWVSVPQIITRATPDNYDLQYREKSILGLFQEAGFKTYWLSNQSDQDIFWSGSITLHAKSADVSIFSPTYSPNLEFENIYDGRLLPILDSVLHHDRNNLFVVLHTMGNHWDYSRRYPPEYDFFQPSATTQVVDPTDVGSKEAILNSYDNSIRYADSIIHSAIAIVDRHADVAALMFISDHGEDLFDGYDDRLDFHFRPSVATLKVPLFVWTSKTYNAIFPDKRRNLEANVSMKIGTENIFYTVADLANMYIDEYSSTRSFAQSSFQPSSQKYYGDDKRANLFSQLPVPVK